MDPLTRQTCVACRSDSPVVTDAEIAEFSLQIPDWEILIEDGIRKLNRAFKFEDFGQAVSFGNRVAELAESEDHHPRITTEWGRVAVTWWTHKIRNLHRNDFIAAAKTDGIYI